MIDRFARRWHGHQVLRLEGGRRREVVGVPSDHFVSATKPMTRKQIRAALARVQAEQRRREET